MKVMSAIRRQASLFSVRPALAQAVLANGSGLFRCASSGCVAGGLAGLRMEQEWGLGSFSGLLPLRETLTQLRCWPAAQRPCGLRVSSTFGNSISVEHPRKLATARPSAHLRPVPFRLRVNGVCGAVRRAGITSNFGA
jgi:hypothetical protein